MYTEGFKERESTEKREGVTMCVCVYVCLSVCVDIEEYFAVAEKIYSEGSRK